MDYKDYNDYEILSYIAESNEEAMELMFEKYQPLINVTANRMYSFCKNTGLEFNDLIQEGMLGLNMAIRTFENDKDATFCTYARTCIERKMISLVVGAKRQKHKILNESVSFERADEYDEKYIDQKCLEDNSLNPENILVDSETEEEILKKAKEILTILEFQVFELRKSGFNYMEIGEILDKDVKSIDNAVQRIRNKMKGNFENRN